jgi:hypothetical protein
MTKPKCCYCKKRIKDDEPAICHQNVDGYVYRVSHVGCGSKRRKS